MKTLNYKEIFNQAWSLIKPEIALSAALTLALIAANFFISKIPFLGLFITAPLNAGYLRCILKIVKKEEIDYTDFFWGYMQLNRFLHLILAQFLMTLIVFLGFIVLIVPGIYLSVTLSFYLNDFISQDPDGVGCLKNSKNIVTGHWFEVCGLLLMNVIIIILGVLCLGIGLLVAVPISVLILQLAYDKLKQASSLVQPSTNDIT